VHDERETQKHPWQIGSLEYEQAQEAEQCVGVLPTPYVYERATERGTKECHGEHWRYAEKKRRSKGKQPREVSWRPSGGLFEEARVSLEEEDVVEEVETERTKVKEGRYQSPILTNCELRYGRATIGRLT
jgi:hypothetical protein